MRFGILGAADIAQKQVVPAIQRSDHEVVAIGSRSKESAERFAALFDIPRAYGSYEAVLSDREVEAVYIPLPNSLHAEWTKQAADADLHVLCEKPLATSAREARETFEYCANRGVTLMEAFMYRHHPRTERAAEIVDEELGEVRAVSASFKFPLAPRVGDIRLNSELAGGSLMDIGCYAVSAVRLFCGEPTRVYGHTVDSRASGVDTEMAATLEYDSGPIARVASSFDVPNVERYRVETTNGWLEVRNAFSPDKGERVSLDYGVSGRQATETFDAVDHYQLEVEHFAECVESGNNPRVDARETIRNMAVIDAIAESASRGEPVILGE